ncbi:tRNA lysidine(34) synthetase TilS [Neptunicella marina]|uniref:tRNA lysidine(34) synthetase TilS n=1 Tax=Neptunicella marina TaxID=2125989 RepID=UPI0016440784
MAYSGGLDSSVLLHVIAQLKPQFPQHQFSAIHVHHGLSANADSWLQHCQNNCERYAIAFQSVKVHVSAARRTSLEQQARDARYAAIEQNTSPGCRILLAQHADDQLETFLLQLKRGAGPKGLASMAAHMTKNQREYIRPLLPISREQLEEYANFHQLTWVEDESNSDSRFDRNFLRNDVLPVLKSRWSGLLKSVSRSANLCAEQQQLLDEVALEKLQPMLKANGSLKTELLSQQSQPWQKQLLRLWFEQNNVPMPSEAIMQNIGPQLLATDRQSEAEISWAGWSLRKYQDALYLLNSQMITPIDKCFTWTGEDTLQIDPCLKLKFNTFTDGLTLCIPANAKIEIRFGQLTERFKPAGKSHSKPLKQWLKGWNVPPWQRQRLPLIYIDERLAMVVGFAVAEGAEQGERQLNISLETA